MSDALSKGLHDAAGRARGLAGVFQGFKDFVSRGNAVELAVGVVIGAAFSTVVQAIQKGLLEPVIGLVFGQPTFGWVISLPRDGRLDPGLIISALINFLLTAAAIYFVIVLPLNKLAERRKRGIEAEPARPSEDILLLQEIRDLLAAQSAPARPRHAVDGPTAADPTAGPTGTGPA